MKRNVVVALLLGFCAACGGQGGSTAGVGNLATEPVKKASCSEYKDNGVSCDADSRCKWDGYACREK